MNSFHIKIDQVDSSTGRMRLWDTAFPANDAPNIAEGTFPLDPLVTPQRPGDPTRADMLRFIQGDSNPYPGRFESVGDTLRRLVEPSGVLDRWSELVKPESRTYLETSSMEKEVEPKLADLPWEYLAKVEGGAVDDRYFADRIVIRVHKGGDPDYETPLIKGLIVTGEPLDWEGYKFPTEDVVAVIRAFQSCRHCSHVELLETPTLEALEARLEKLEPQILHFSGHGEVSDETGLPALRISAPTGRWWWDTSKILNTFRPKQQDPRLVKVPRQVQVPRLVVLNACDTGKPSDGLYSVMQVLQRRGVTAVVGTQAAVSQDATKEFSRRFYQELSAGRTVDVAVAEARLALGKAANGAGWLRRDWGLYVLSVSTPPEQLWKTTEPSQMAMGCATLKEFYREEGYTAPFVSLGTCEARLEFLTALGSQSCIVVKGPEGCGKTWLVRRSLRDAVSFGYSVQYVSVGSLEAPANFVDLLRAIREGDPKEQQRGSHIHQALPREPFADFHSIVDGLTQKEIANLSANEITLICEKFENGLEEVAKLKPLTIVLDQFSRGIAPRVSFSPAEFNKDGVKDIWRHIAAGQVKNVQLLVAVIVDDSLRVNEYRDYQLDSLPVPPIELSDFQNSEFSKLFFEFFRFARIISRKKRVPVDLDKVRQAWEYTVPTLGWKARLFENIYEQSRSFEE